MEIPKDPKVMRERAAAIAVHEAGHLFAAAYFGFQLREKVAELSNPPGHFGLAYFVGEDVHFDGSEASRVRCESAVMVLLAGGAAVSILHRQYEGGEYLNGSDEAQARAIIDSMLSRDAVDLPWHTEGWSGIDRLNWDGERWPYFTALQYRAERILARGGNWSIVLAIAAELMCEGSITAAAVRNLIQRRQRRAAHLTPGRRSRRART